MSMLTTIELPESLAQKYEANKERGRLLAADLAGVGEEMTLEGNIDLLAWEEPAYVYVRGAAYFKFYHSDRLLRMYSEGDFIPTGPRFVTEEAKILCDFAAEVTLFTPAALQQALRENAALLTDWMAYQDTDQAIIYALCASQMQIQQQPDLRLQRVEPGQHIIREGEASNEVFVLIDGSAEVRSRDVTVGEIKPPEFFGEIGFLLNQPRTASVIATTTCTVQIVDNDSFVELIKVNPPLILSLATTLATRVVDLNDRVVQGQEHHI
jgi:CRP-like cAMP-binding protein